MNDPEKVRNDPESVRNDPERAGTILKGQDRS
jgi:hypothetical protein